MVHGTVRRGGSVGLVGLIDRYGEAIDADLAQFYGIDILDFFRGTLPAGRVFRLLEVLPDTSRMHAMVLADPEHQQQSGSPEPWRELYGWGGDRHMLAHLWDLLAAVNTAKGKKPPAFPRGATKKSSQGIPLADLMPKRRKRPVPKRPVPGG